MFNKKYKKRIQELEKETEIWRSLSSDRGKELISLGEELSKIKSDPDTLMAALMRESLGIQIDFSIANDKGLPPDFLQDLTEEERKNFIIDMETIYSNERWKLVIKYFINLFGMNAIYKYDDELKRSGQIAVVAFRTLLKRFDSMHIEFLSYRKNEDGDFDPLEILPN